MQHAPIPLAWVDALRCERPGYFFGGRRVVRYQGFKASVAIEDGRVLAGSFPPKQLKLVQAWVELHWELVVHGEEPFRIAPLQ